jgi:hypothetical protein
LFEDEELEEEFLPGILAAEIEGCTSDDLTSTFTEGFWILGGLISIDFFLPDDEDDDEDDEEDDEDFFLEISTFALDEGNLIPAFLELLELELLDDFLLK